jgi:hypothetical protein
MDWLGWVIPTVFTLAISIAAFFIKRSINKKDKEREAKDAKWEQEQRDLKDLIVSELKSFRTENEDRHCKTEAHVQKVEERLNKTLQELPIYYTLRDDWQRSTSNIDRKLDGIQNTLIQIYRGGKQGNE